MKTSLIFVYNATSDTKSKWVDFAHKIVSPSTYNCDLCRLTHGVFRERKTWNDFKIQSGISMEFVYKDQFLNKYAHTKKVPRQYPVVLSRNHQEELEIIFSSQEISAFNSLADLIGALRKKIETIRIG